MPIIAGQLRSRNLVPFKKRRGIYDIPGLIRDENQIAMDKLDHDLSPEEQSFIRHYLGYADTLLNSVPEDYTPQAEVSQEGTLSDVPGCEQKNPTDKAA
jgi:hypothetical protein